MKKILNLDYKKMRFRNQSLNATTRYLFLLLSLSALIYSFINLRVLTFAHSSSNDWTSGKDTAWAPDNYDLRFYQSGSYYYTDSTLLRWGSSSASNLKNSGHRYTQDNTNGTGSCSEEHFSATGNWGTNFPNPVYDRDNDTWYCNTSSEEAEITSDNFNFPTAGSNYFTTMQWTRTGSGTGQIYFVSQMSNYQWPEWNTVHYDLLRTHNYSSSGATKSWVNLFVGLNNYPPFTRIALADFDGERNVTIDQKIKSRAELEEYLTQAKNNVSLLRSKGFTNSRVVVTFSRPLSSEEFIYFLTVSKVKISSFEMRATDSSGEIITMGGSAQNGVVDPLGVYEQMRNNFSLRNLDGLTFKGVTSFDGEIYLDNYESLSSYHSVYFVDVTPESAALELITQGLVGREEKLDVNLNDLYWYKEYYDSACFR